MGRPDASGLFAAWMGMLTLALIGANPPAVSETGLLEGEVNLLSMLDEPSTSGAKDPTGLENAALDGRDAYFKIPNFEFSHLSSSEPVPDRMTCQRMCNQNPKCKSYSYRPPSQDEKENAKETTPVADDEEKAEKVDDVAKTPPLPLGVCKCSAESLHYRIGWKFYTKAKDVDWKGRPHLTTENFHEFPGLEYQVPDFKLLTDTSLTECKDKCAKDETCGAFSFNEEVMHCRMAGTGLNYNAHFSYYEKPVAPKNRESTSETDISTNSALLQTQEKEAKKAANSEASNKKKQRDLAAEKFAKNHHHQSIQNEKSHKHQSIVDAQNKIKKLRHTERVVKDNVQVEAAFQKAYFQAEGASHEQKVKEVKLKKIDLHHQDIMYAQEVRQKHGEIGQKNKAVLHKQKIAKHEIKIETAKEKIGKIKNKQKELELHIEAQTFKDLTKDESVAIHNIEAKHEAKIQALQRWDKKALEITQEEEQNLHLKQQTVGSTNQEWAAATEKAKEVHDAAIKEMQDETLLKVKEIIANAIPKEDPDDAE